MTLRRPSAATCARQLRRSVSQLCRKLRPDFQRAGVSMAKLSVIGHVNRSGSISPTELAAREGVRLQTLTRLLAELELEGWLVRARHRLDGRQSLLSLTPQGKRRLDEAARASDRALAAILDSTFSAEESNLLLRACGLLDRLDEALSRHHEPELQTGSES